MTKRIEGFTPPCVSEALILENLACRRGGRLLFEGICARVEPGGALLLIGPNGAGKSSLLRLVGGLLQAAGGACHFGGRRSYLGHETALKPRETLGGELRYWAGLDGGLARLPAALMAMNLAALVDVPCRMLSSGQKRRAGLARVMASGAELWLLDEPTAGLDAASAALLAAAMAAHRAAGGIVVAAVHGEIGLMQAQELRLG
jgi:heme exporter protein A